MIQINYAIDPVSLARFSRRMKNFSQKLQSYDQERTLVNRQLLDEADTLMRSRWRANFNAGGGLYGTWPPLDADTIAEKGGRMQPLVRTGGMRGKFFNAMYAKRTAQSLTWTFPNYHGLVYHHYGTRSVREFPNKYGNAPYVGFATMHEPPRPLVGFNRNDRKDIERIMSAHTRKFVSISWHNT